MLQSRVASEAVPTLLNNGLTREGVPRAEHVGVSSIPAALPAAFLPSAGLREQKRDRSLC